MAKSDITGKRKLLAQNVSHSNIKTKRWQNVNIQTRRVWVPELNRFVTLQPHDARHPHDRQDRRGRVREALRRRAVGQRGPRAGRGRPPLRGCDARRALSPLSGRKGFSSPRLECRLRDGTRLMQSARAARRRTQRTCAAARCASRQPQRASTAPSMARAASADGSRCRPFRCGRCAPAAAHPSAGCVPDPAVRPCCEVGRARVALVAQDGEGGLAPPRADL